MEAPKPRSPLELYPYQQSWIEDNSRLKIATKARRIGFSFAEGLDAVLDCIETPKKNHIVLSRGERLSKLFIEDSIAPHVRSIGVVASFIEGTLPESSIYKQEVVFANGSRIIALPANPETARSYEGDVTLDEYAFQQDAREIYVAIEPSITRGFRLRIISTPNGQQGEYYEIAKAAGLVDGRAVDKSWSPHHTTILEAIAQGCKDRFGNPLDAKVIRAGCLDEEMWLQEYMCQFVSIASQWIPPELFEGNISPEATCGNPNPNLVDLYAGWDVARNKDLSVIWLNEIVGDVSWTRGVIEMANVPTPDQVAQARSLMKMCRRLVIDKSGMGIAIFEQLEQEFWGRVEGVTFTLATKEDLAVHAKKRMLDFKARIPDTDMIRNSFRSVKKSTTATGQNRFDADHDEKYGHADHWWAFCLAECAAGQPTTLGLVELVKKKQHEEVQKAAKSEANKSAALGDTLQCPECESASIAKVGGQNRCSQCGHQWGGKNITMQGQSRRDLFSR